MARIGIHILTKDCSWNDELPYSQRKRYHCKFCAYEGHCTFDHKFNDCEYEHKDNKTLMENCKAGYDIDEICNKLAMQEPSGIKEILLELCGIKSEEDL